MTDCVLVFGTPPSKFSTIEYKFLEHGNFQNPFQNTISQSS